MPEQFMFPVRKRNADAADLAKRHDDKRARRDVGNGVTIGRTGSPDYWDGMSDDKLLQLLAESPSVARLVDGPRPAASRDTASDTRPGKTMAAQSASAESDDEYGSVPDLSDYQLDALDKGLSIEVDGYPLTNPRNLEDAAIRTLRDEFQDEGERWAKEAWLKAKFAQQREQAQFEVEWNTAKLEELKGKLTKVGADGYDGATYSRVGVEYNRNEGVAPVEDKKLAGHLRAYQLSFEYQEDLRKIFCSAGNAGQVHRPPPQSKQPGLFDDAVGDELLIVGKPDVETGRCLLQTQKQHTQEFGRKIVSRGGERINETLDAKLLLFKSLDGKDSLQPVQEFGRANDPVRVQNRLKKHNVSTTRITGGKSMLDATYYPPLLIRTFKNSGEPKVAAMWPHREQIGDLTDLINQYGEKNVWQKTEGNIYKHPAEYNRSEPDSVFRTFAQMTGSPVAWVRTEDDGHLDVPTYCKRYGPIEHGPLDAWVLARGGDALITPATLRELEPEIYEATMHMVGLPPDLTETRSNETPHAALADDSTGASPQMPVVDSPAMSIPRKKPDPRDDERANERSSARKMSRA